jgi:hypothetical protein
LDTFNDEARARIRGVLLAHAKENQLSVDKLFQALCRADRQTAQTVGFSFKTFQRFLADTHRVGDDVVAACARFAKGLPNRSSSFDALGSALYATYKIPLMTDIAGSYTLNSNGKSLARVTISPPYGGDFSLVTEHLLGRMHRLFDGVLVRTGSDNYFCLLKDRSMRTPHTITIRANEAVVYDFCPLLHPGQPYILRTGKLTRA